MNYQLKHQKLKLKKVSEETAFIKQLEKEFLKGVEGIVDAEDNKYIVYSPAELKGRFQERQQRTEAPVEVGKLRQVEAELRTLRKRIERKETPEEMFEVKKGINGKEIKK